MTQADDRPPLGLAEVEEIIEGLKSTRRDEMLSRLNSLLRAAERKATNPKSTPQIQQRWFTICGYLSQVKARILRDLDYEKLRADVENLKAEVSSSNVPTEGRKRAQT